MICEVDIVLLYSFSCDCGFILKKPLILEQTHHFFSDIECSQNEIETNIEKGLRYNVRYNVRLNVLSYSI